MNEAIWKSTLLLSSLYHILALKYLWNKVWQYMIMECNSLCNYAAHCDKKQSYEAFDKCETPTLPSHPKSDLLWNMGKSICTLQWGQYNKPQWLMEQPVLAILLYNIIFCVINTLKSQDKWLILSAYFSLMNRLQLDSVFKRNNFVAKKKLPVY